MMDGSRGSFYARGMMAARLMLTCLLLSAAAAFAQEAPPSSPQATAVVSLVNKAAAAIDAKGKAAFAEMKNAPDQWKPGDLYLFVGDLNGKALYNGGFPKIEGTDTSGLKDSTGKLIVKEQIDLVKKAGAGWVHYMWPKAGQTTPLQKWSYVKKTSVDGVPAYVGAGFYPEK
jgi:signal transduction histidine kinase